MAIPISRFRREIFDLVNRAARGEEVSFTHQGRLFRVQPEVPPTTRLERLTPLQVVNPVSGGLDQKDWQQEMIQAWERDWADL
jgi:antitoxin (DNA-binding transcriptional repressor) of toxin-antitoxin stability system